MDDTISRQAAIDAIQGIGRLATLPDNDAVIRMSAVEYVLFNLPSADVIEVVRCKDCADWDKTWQPSAEGHYCPSIDLVTKPDFYCGYGERREDDKIH